MKIANDFKIVVDVAELGVEDTTPSITIKTKTNSIAIVINRMDMVTVLYHLDAIIVLLQERLTKERQDLLQRLSGKEQERNSEIKGGMTI